MIKSIHITTASVAITFLSAFSAQAQTIFAPSKDNCRPYVSDSFKFCKAEPVTVAFAKVSDTTLEILEGLPVENSMSYKLFCPSWPDAQPVELKSAGRSQTLLASSKAVVESVKETVSHSDLVTSAYLFTPLIKREATIEANCKMEVISNVTTPNLAYLKAIADLLKEDFSSLKDLVAKLEKASELPETWSALVASTQTIEDSATSLDFEKAQLDAELQELLGLPESELTSEDQNRKEMLPYLIEKYTLISSNLRKAKDDIGKTLKIAEKCGLGAPDAFCIQSVNKLVNDIKGEVSTRSTRMTKFSTFLSLESGRLKDVAKRLSKQLADLSAEVNP
jgi:hypothetical protein